MNAAAWPDEPWPQRAAALFAESAMRTLATRAGVHAALCGAPAAGVAAHRLAACAPVRGRRRLG
jgi:hypothetical protein